MSKNEEEGRIIDGIDVSTCRNITFEHHDGKVTRFNVCECGVQGVEYYNMMCSDNPDCYYKQLQREKQKNKKLKNTLKEIAEIAKTKIYTPACFEDPDCPKNGGVGFDNQCDEYCPILTIGKILEKIKEVKNDN